MSIRMKSAAKGAMLLVACGATNALADAQSLSIATCNGEIREVQQIESGATGSIKLAVTNAAEGSRVTLSRAAGKTYTSDVVNGEVEFSSVSAGNWRVCFESANAGIDQISFAVNEGSSLVTASLVTAAVGGVGLAIGSSSGGSGSREAAPAELSAGAQESAIATDSALSEGFDESSSSSNSSSGINAPSRPVSARRPSNASVDSSVTSEGHGTGIGSCLDDDETVVPVDPSPSR